MELVGDELGVGEEGLGEALVGVAQVERHEAHVFSPWDVSECELQVVTAFAVHHLHQAMIRVVYYHANKFSFV